MSRDIKERDQDFAGFQAINAADAQGDHDLATLRQVPWQRVSATSFRLPPQRAGEDVGCIVATNTQMPCNTAVFPEPCQLLMLAKPVDHRTSDVVSGDTGRGSSGIGVRVGQLSDSVEPIWIKTGDHLFTETAGLITAKAIPTLINSPLVKFDGVNDVVDTTQFIAIVMSHTALASDGPVNVGRAIQLFLDGAPDVNPQVTVTQAEGNGMFAILVGGDFCDLGEGILWGQGHAGSIAGYEDVQFGSSAPISRAGHIRRAFYELDTGPLSKGFIVSVDGSPWVPLPVRIPFYTFHDPAATTYANGMTVVKHIVSTDTGYKGLRSLMAVRWTLPPQITISGGHLTAKIRFNLSSGSFEIVSNQTANEVVYARELTSLGMAASWVTSIDLIVDNDSGSTSSSQDVGPFECAWEAI